MVGPVPSGTRSSGTTSAAGARVREGQARERLCGKAQRPALDLDLGVLRDHGLPELVEGRHVVPEQALVVRELHVLLAQHLGQGVVLRDRHDDEVLVRVALHHGLHGGVAREVRVGEELLHRGVHEQVALGIVGVLVDLDGVAEELVVVRDVRAQAGDGVVAVRRGGALLGVVGDERRGHAHGIAHERHVVARAHLEALVHARCHREARAHAADGEEEHRAHQGDGEPRGVDAAVELAHHEHVEATEIGARARLERAQRKAGDREEEEQGAHRDQARGDGEVRALLHHAVLEQDLVRHADERERHEEEHHGERQAAQADLLAHLVRVDEVDELVAADRGHVEDERHEEDAREARHRGEARGRREGEDEALDRSLEEPGRDVHHDLREADAQKQAHRQRDHAHDERLYDDDPRDVPDVHAQREVDAKLALAPPYEEAVGIDDEKAEDDDNEDGEARQDVGEGLHHTALVLGHVDDGRLVGDGAEGVEHADAEGERQEEDREVPEGLADVHLPPPLPGRTRRP